MFKCVDSENESVSFNQETGTLTYDCHRATGTGIYVDIPSEENVFSNSVSVTMEAMSTVKVTAEYLGYYGGHCQVFDGEDWRGVAKYIKASDSYFELKF